MKQIAILISGTGTNLKNLAEEWQKNLQNKCKIAIVISNKDGVKGLEIAQDFGIKTLVLPDLTKKVSITSHGVENYNLFVKLKAEAEEAFVNITNVFKRYDFTYSFFELIEDCFSKVPSLSSFPEEDIKEKVLEVALFKSFEENENYKKEHDELIFNQIDLMLYDLMEEIKLIANLYEFLLKNPSFMKFIAREKYDEILNHALKKENIDYIFLAGFMRILSPSFVKRWENKIINIHPSLLPAFGGAKAVKDALNYGVKITGCTVHFVDAGVDSGKIIAQKALEIYPEDTEETLHERIKKLEKELYPQVFNDLINNKI